jgi:hypothetical protein
MLEWIEASDLEVEELVVGVLWDVGVEGEGGGGLCLVRVMGKGVGGNGEFRDWWRWRRRAIFGRGIGDNLLI